MSRAAIILICFLLTGCYSGTRLVKVKNRDGTVLIAKSEIFSGISYLYFEKKVKRGLLYSIIYDCECGIGNNKTRIHKSVYLDGKPHSLWLAVTDTSKQFALFDEVIDSTRIYQPFTFMKMTDEETSLITEALAKVNKECCRHAGKPFEKVIGYVRQRGN